MTFKFGDIVTNGWASEDNPTKKGIVAEVKKDTLRLTDGNGYFWEARLKDHKLEVIGSVIMNGWS